MDLEPCEGGDAAEESILQTQLLVVLEAGIDDPYLVSFLLQDASHG